MTGQKIAYIRVSSDSQNTARQLDGMTFDKTFIDKVTGSSANRPGLQEMIGYAREGDEIHCHSIDRLARSMPDLARLVSDWKEKGVTVVFHKENLTFNASSDNAMDELLFNIMASFAQFERSLIRERQKEGIRKAQEAGKYRGRIPLSQEIHERVLKLVELGLPKTKIAKQVGISRNSIYEILKKQQENSPPAPSGLQ